MKTTMVVAAGGPSKDRTSGTKESIPRRFNA